MARLLGDIYNFVRKRVPASKISDDELRLLFEKGPGLGGGPYLWACAALRAYVDVQKMNTSWKEQVERYWPIFADWVRSTRTTAFHRHPWHIGINAAVEWHNNRQFAQRRRSALLRIQKIRPSRRRVLMTFPDKTFWYQLLGRECTLEGHASGHCLTNRPTKAASQTFDFSLRDADNTPLVTMTIIKRADLHKFEQAQANWNKVDVQFRTHVFAWLDAWVKQHGKFNSIGLVDNFLGWFSPLPMDIQHMGAQADLRPIRQRLAPYLTSWTHLLTEVGLVSLLTSGTINLGDRAQLSAIQQVAPSQVFQWLLTHSAAIEGLPPNDPWRILVEFTKRSGNDTSHFRQAALTLRLPMFAPLRAALRNWHNLWTQERHLIEILPTVDIAAMASDFLARPSRDVPHQLVRRWARLPLTIRTALVAADNELAYALGLRRDLPAGVKRPLLAWTYTDLVSISTSRVRHKIFDQLIALAWTIDSVEPRGEDLAATAIGSAAQAAGLSVDAAIEALVPLLADALTYADDIGRPFPPEMVVDACSAASFYSESVTDALRSLGIEPYFIEAFAACLIKGIQVFYPPFHSNFEEVVEAVVDRLTTADELTRAAIAFDEPLEYIMDAEPTAMMCALKIASTTPRPKTWEEAWASIDNLEPPPSALRGAQAILTRVGFPLSGPLMFPESEN